MITAVARHFRHTLAQAVHDGRTAMGWSQEELSRRSGVSRSMVGRVEAGAVNLTVDVAGRLLTSLGIAVRLEVDAPFVASRQRDAAHARCVGQIRRRLEAAGWITASEVEIAAGRARGWIDILAFQPESETLLVIEVKTELADVGATERQLRWYRSSAVHAARAMGWQPRRVEVALLVLATQANHARVAANADVLHRSFSAPARDLDALIHDRRPMTGAAIAFLDPTSRRSSWLLRAGIHGRRTPMPYADYADFMRRSSSRRSR